MRHYTVLTFHPLSEHSDWWRYHSAINSALNWHPVRLVSDALNPWRIHPLRFEFSCLHRGRLYSYVGASSIVSSAPPLVPAAPPLVPAAPPLVPAAPPLVSAAPPLVSAAPPLVPAAPPLVSAAPPRRVTIVANPGRASWVTSGRALCPRRTVGLSGVISTPPECCKDRPRAQDCWDDELGFERCLSYMEYPECWRSLCLTAQDLPAGVTFSHQRDFVGCRCVGF